MAPFSRWSPDGRRNTQGVRAWLLGMVALCGGCGGPEVEPGCVQFVEIEDPTGFVGAGVGEVRIVWTMGDASVVTFRCLPKAAQCSSDSTADVAAWWSRSSGGSSLSLYTGVPLETPFVVDVSAMDLSGSSRSRRVASPAMGSVCGHTIKLSL